MEDIYRHYEQKQDREIGKAGDDGAEEDDPDDDYDGEVTGYAAVPNNNHGGHFPVRGIPAKVGYSGTGGGGGYAGGGGYSNSGYGGSGNKTHFRCL